MLKQFEQIAARGQVLPFVFVQDAVAASQTDVQINIQEVSGGMALAVSELSMPWAGRVVGISVNTSAAATAGSLTVGATIDGTEQTASTQTITTATAAYAVIPQGSIKFNAGQKLGVEITTSASWDAVTADLAVIVYVLMDLQGV
jgi:hypothetical protein